MYKLACACAQSYHCFCCSHTRYAGKYTSVNVPSTQRHYLIRIFTGRVWIAKDAKFLHENNVDSNQTTRISRLICLRWVYSCHVVHFLTFQLMYSDQCPERSSYLSKENHWSTWSNCNVGNCALGHVRPTTLISLCIRTVLAESSVSAWTLRKHACSNT